MPTEEQIRKRELFHFLPIIGDNYNGLMNPLMSDNEYNEWLQTRVGDTAGMGDASTLANESVILEGTICGKGFAPEEEKRTYAVSLGTGTLLVGCFPPCPMSRVKARQYLLNTLYSSIKSTIISTSTRPQMANGIAQLQLWILDFSTTS
jgi:hypothetical protein